MKSLEIKVFVRKPGANLIRTAAINHCEANRLNVCKHCKKRMGEMTTFTTLEETDLGSSEE